MDVRDTDPYGAALLAYFEGDVGAELLVRRDDGLEAPLPAGHFFREPEAFTPIDNAAIERCQGHVLDVGAGTGLHALELQRRGLQVIAIDLCPQAVHIMTRRGVENVQRAGLFDHVGAPADTVLMLGHGLGMVETIDGLDRFLAHVHNLITAGGQVLFDSLDVRVTDDPKNVAYHDLNRKAGRSIGEIRLQFEFAGHAGPWCRWLHVDAETLDEHASAAGWDTEMILDDDHGNYLARLTGG